MNRYFDETSLNSARIPAEQHVARVVLRVATLSWLLVLLLGGQSLAGTLVIYDSAALPTDLDPFRLGSSVQGLRLSTLIFERMTRLNREDNILELGFFETPAPNTDTTHTLRLKAGLKWSDASPLTARDVASSFSRLRERARSSRATPAEEALYRSLYLLSEVKALDDTRVQFVFQQPVHSLELPILLAPVPIVPEKAKDAELAGPGAIGCGPYVVDGVSRDMVRLGANPFYYLGRPAIPEIQLITLSQEELAEALSKPGHEEMFPSPPPGLLNGPMDVRNLTIRFANTPRVLYLGFNLRQGSVFAEAPALRNVISSLIDRQQLFEAVPAVDPNRLLLDGPYAANSIREAGAEVVPGTSSVDFEAQLAQIGLQRSGENFRDARGRVLKLRLLVCTSIPSYRTLATQIQGQIQARGIDVEVTPIDPEVFRQILEKPDGSFDLILHEWLLDEREDVYEIFHSKGIYNYLGYSNPEIDSRLELERRARLTHSKLLFRTEITRILELDKPVLFLWRRHDVVAFRTDLKNVPPLDSYFLFRDVQVWRLDDSPGGGAAKEAQPASSETGEEPQGGESAAPQGGESTDPQNEKPEGVEASPGADDTTSQPKEGVESGPGEQDPEKGSSEGSPTSDPSGVEVEHGEE